MATQPIVAVVAWRAGPTNAPLVEGWRRLGIAAELVTPHDAVRHLGAGDAALVRLDVTETLDGVEPGLLEVARLARRGVRLLNRPPSLLAAHDKWQTAQRLTDAGIPHPRTVHRTQLHEIRSAAPPFVLKPRFGSWGQDVMLCRSVDDAERCLAIIGDRAWFRRHGVLVQELVPLAGEDLRLIVAAQRIVGAARRHASPGEWRTNMALGARAVPTRPPSAACALAIQTAAALGTDFAGVDLLPLPDGSHVVIEVNGAAEFDAADSLPGRDLYRDAAAALQLLPAVAATAEGRWSIAGLRRPARS
ncbi:MAG: ATP-grasp domain-containing protein [Solirubrobacteraceae bacterium]